MRVNIGVRTTGEQRQDFSDKEGSRGHGEFLKSPKSPLQVGLLVRSLQGTLVKLIHLVHSDYSVLHGMIEAHALRLSKR